MQGGPENYPGPELSAGSDGARVGALTFSPIVVLLRVMIRASLLILALLAVAGCAGGSETADSLTGSTWVLDRLVSPDGSVERGDGARMTFGASGTLSLDSCNLCSGRYRISGDVLTVAEATACTRRACPSGTLELERYFAAPMTVRRDGAYLILDPVDPASPQPQLLFAPDAPPSP